MLRNVADFFYKGVEADRDSGQKHKDDKIDARKTTGDRYSKEGKEKRSDKRGNAWDDKEGGLANAWRLQNERNGGGEGAKETEAAIKTYPHQGLHLPEEDI